MPRIVRFSMASAAVFAFGTAVNSKRKKSNGRLYV